MTARPISSPASDAVGEMVASLREDNFHEAADLLTRLDAENKRLAFDVEAERAHRVIAERDVALGEPMIADATSRAERAEAERDALKAQIDDIKAVTDARLEDRATAAENGAEVVAALQADLSALKGRVVEVLEPFANFRLEGFDCEVLEVVPSWPENPARRIEPIWASHFRRAAELHATLMQKGRAR